MVRAQSKYGLMGSSAKTGKKIFRGSQEQFLDKTVIWDRTPLQLYIKYSVYVLGRAQGSQIFKRNSIISIRSKVMAFLVILLSPSSPHCPRHPHIVPTLSPHRPRHPPIIPPSSPEDLHVVSMAVVSVVSIVSTPCYPLGPRGPHVVPVVPTSSPSGPHRPHVIPIAPRRSPCGPHGCGLRCLHPMLSLCCPRRPHRPHIIPVSSPSSPHHLEAPHIIPNSPDTHSTHPLPPWGVGGSESVKMQ